MVFEITVRFDKEEIKPHVEALIYVARLAERKADDEGRDARRARRLSMAGERWTSEQILGVLLAVKTALDETACAGEVREKVAAVHDWLGFVYRIIQTRDKHLHQLGSVIYG